MITLSSEALFDIATDTSTGTYITNLDLRKNEGIVSRTRMEKAFRLLELASPLNQPTTPKERPLPMRLRRADLAGRVNGLLRFCFTDRKLTSYAGLELVREYLSGLDWNRRLRRAFGRSFPRSDFGAVALVRLILGLLLVGGRRLWHLRYVAADPMVQRFCGLRHLPTAMTVGAWLRRFNEQHVRILQELNADITAETMRSIGLRRLTLDVDGSVLSTGLRVEGARRGFNPHHRKVPSYYPITAYEAQSGQMLRVENRAGNVHDGKASLPFLEDLVEQIQSRRGYRDTLEFRMDGAFFRQDVLEFLDRCGAEWAIKVPFYPWLHLKTYVLEAPAWSKVADGVFSSEARVAVKSWDRVLRIVIYRKRVLYRTKKNFQLDIFDPNDGYWEYSAICTNKMLSPRALWHFLNGRGAHEKALGELKSGFAFDAVPTLRYAANSAWQVLSILAFNLSRGFQIATGATSRRPNRKRRCRYRFDSIHTLRFKLLGRAGLLTAPAGRSTLDLGPQAAVKQDFNRTLEHLRAA